MFFSTLPHPSHTPFLHHDSHAGCQSRSFVGLKHFLCLSTTTATVSRVCMDVEQKCCSELLSNRGFVAKNKIFNVKCPILSDLLAGERFYDDQIRWHPLSIATFSASLFVALCTSLIAQGNVGICPSLVSPFCPVCLPSLAALASILLVWSDFRSAGRVSIVVIVRILARILDAGLLSGNDPVSMRTCSAKARDCDWQDDVMNIIHFFLLTHIQNSVLWIVSNALYVCIFGVMPRTADRCASVNSRTGDGTKGTGYLLHKWVAYYVWWRTSRQMTHRNVAHQESAQLLREWEAWMQDLKCSKYPLHKRQAAHSHVPWSWPTLMSSFGTG